MSSDTVLMSTDTTPFALYHLLGVLCWLYPVGYPRIGTTYGGEIQACEQALCSRCCRS